VATHRNGTTRLAQMLYLWRTVHRLSLRDAAHQMGTTSATLMRIEHGHACDVETWMKVQGWLFERIGPPPRADR
jgi:hypothetical protein